MLNPIRTLASSTPEAAGFSGDRLARIEARYAAGVEAGEIPGAVVLVLRDGQVVYDKAIGFRDRAAGAAMTSDTVFWLASMTKPVTSVAIMMLVEEGLVDLNAEAALYLPELAGLKVGVPGDDGALTTRAPMRQPTVHDLLRHTAGLVYGEFGDTPVHQAYIAANLFARDRTNAEFIERLAQLPLAAEPGSTFEYSVATDVLGRIVEVVSGQSLDVFFRSRIAEPLGLTALDFHVAEGRPLAWSDAALPEGAQAALDGMFRSRPTLLSGGGGLFGTAADYARFGQMLLNGGSLDGVRLLAPATVALMTANHLPDGVAFAPKIVSMLSVIAPTPALGQGFGLGFAVRTDPGLHPAAGSVGDYFWAGAGGTYFWVDPVEGLVVVALTAQPDYVCKVRFRQLIRTLVYQAIERSNHDPRTPRAG